MIGQRSVLIVDPSEETREVLQTALERRGVRILATGQVKRGRELAQRHRPDLIVLDVESSCGAGVPPAFFGAGESPAPQNQCQPRVVLLGTFRRQGEVFPGGEFVAKPYHYGALIRRIEELLDPIGESGPCRRCLSSAGPTKEPASS